MLISHTLDRGTLRVEFLQDLDITNRAAAALQVEALVAAHRPDEVLLELPPGEPGPATLSAVARAQRMCRSMNVAFTVTGTAVPVPEPSGEAGLRLESGARRRR
ncbi:hypothetical protein ABZ766_34605 [Streptomyces sp. NPDC006670]|uniref:hypothetical protein n=1 Tax=Streptomyces sp. NPDC006670 TaxID=3154476 RepID=UPI00340FA014